MEPCIAINQSLAHTMLGAMHALVYLINTEAFVRRSEHFSALFCKLVIVLWSVRVCGGLFVSQLAEMPPPPLKWTLSTPNMWVCKVYWQRKRAHERVCILVTRRTMCG